MSRRASALEAFRHNPTDGSFAPSVHRSWLVTQPGLREDDQTVAFRGSKSRNKVSVGEPAEGSLSVQFGLVLDEIDNFSGLL